MTIAPLSNGGSELFRKSLDTLAEHADAAFETQRSLWNLGRISDAQFAHAVDVFTRRAEQLQTMMSQWVGEVAP
jgi:hypothetical protein